MVSPRLIHYAERAKIQGTRTIHTQPIQSHLLGPDEVIVRRPSWLSRFFRRIGLWG